MQSNLKEHSYKPHFHITSAIKSFKNSSGLDVTNILSMLVSAYNGEIWKLYNRRNFVEYLEKECQLSKKTLLKLKDLESPKEEELPTIKKRNTDNRKILDDALNQGKGNSSGNNQHSGLGNIDIINISSQQGTGTSKTQALRRLKKDRPDLYDDVYEGKLSAHRAMVQAGFRKETITVSKDPEKAAMALKRHLSSEDIEILKSLL